MKALTWILAIVAVAMTALAVIFIVKNNQNKKKLAEANAALVALGAPAVKSAKPTEGAAIAAGTETGTAVQGTSAGVSATMG